MNLLDIVHRPPTAAPWGEGDNIPWHEPGFSVRMLREHLSQAHDWASRRTGIIDQTVAWIHHQVLQERPTRILDLGCGPGLYTSRLARLGHECVGVDYSPASIQYARAQATAAGLRCTYLEQDLRAADVGGGYGLVMCLYGEFNVFRPAHTDLILEKARQALASQGHLLLEAHTFEAVRQMGGRPPTWTAAESGLFSDRAYIVMKEHLWDLEANAATIRYYVVDARSGEVVRHAQSFQAYTEPEYRVLLARHGFGGVEFSPSWGGEGSGDLVVILSQRVESLFQRALEWATAAHAGQTDKAGKPYIGHPQRVADQFSDETFKTVAILHDVLEDTPTTLEAVAQAFGPAIADEIAALTRQRGEEYMAYVRRVAQRPLARQIKIADLKDNMDLSRLPVVTPRDRERLGRYQRALALLEETPNPSRVGP